MDGTRTDCCIVKNGEHVLMPIGTQERRASPDPMKSLRIHVKCLRSETVESSYINPSDRCCREQQEGIMNV
jgi:hypothetical protein